MDVLEGRISQDVRNAVNTQLESIAADLNREFKDTLDQYQQHEFARGIVDSVDTLPKVDLAYGGGAGKLDGIQTKGDIRPGRDRFGPHRRCTHFER